MGGGAVGADTILDGHKAPFIPAEGRVDDAAVIAQVAVNDGEIFLLHSAGFKQLAEFAGDFGFLGEDDDAAGFAVEAMNQVG